MGTFEVQLISKKEANRILNCERKNMRVERFYFATLEFGSINSEFNVFSIDIIEGVE